MTLVLTVAIFVVSALVVYLLVPKLQPPRTVLGPVFLLLALIGGVLLASRYRTELRLADALFLLAALLAVFSALKAVSHPRILYCALYFVLLVLSTAVLLLLLSAQFLAAALVIIYAGAILVVYLFVIMLAQSAGEPTDPVNPGRVGFAALAGLVLAATASRLPLETGLAPADWTGSNVAALGRAVLIDYVVTLELAGVLLLAAVIGAIALARTRPSRREDLP